MAEKVKKATKAEVKKERDPTKLRKVLEKKTGKPALPKWLEAHHKKPVAEGGKTTPKNIKIVSIPEHKAIHKKNRAKGRV